MQRARFVLVVASRSLPAGVRGKALNAVQRGQRSDDLERLAVRPSDEISLGREGRHVQPANDKLPPTSPRPFAAVATNPLDLSSSPWSFDGVLRRVIGFSRAATLVPRPANPRGATNVRVPDRRDRR